MSDGAIKNDDAKPDLTQLPGQALAQIAAVMQAGAAKYSRDNWRHHDFDHQRYAAAALRHILQWNEGEDNDEETGLSHLAHASCCLMFMLWHKSQNTGRDKRFVSSDPSLTVPGLQKAIQRAALANREKKA